MFANSHKTNLRDSLRLHNSFRFRQNILPLTAQKSGLLIYYLPWCMQGAFLDTFQSHFLLIILAERSQYFYLMQLRHAEWLLLYFNKAT